MGKIQFNFNPLTETTYHDRENQVNHFILYVILRLKHTHQSITFDLFLLSTILYYMRDLIAVYFVSITSFVFSVRLVWSRHCLFIFKLNFKHTHTQN